MLKIITPKNYTIQEIDGKYVILSGRIVKAVKTLHEKAEVKCFTDFNQL